eukprot:jgi/Mesvir1/15185/Mv06424-RA.1
MMAMATSSTTSSLQSLTSDFTPRLPGVNCPQRRHVSNGVFKPTTRTSHPVACSAGNGDATLSSTATNHMGRRTLLSAAFLLNAGWLWPASSLADPLAFPPRVGTPAPDFDLPTNTGSGRVKLSDYRGRWVVVYFYPKDFTGGCTLEAARFQRDLPEFEKRNAAVLGISVDSVDSHRDFCEKNRITFPLLADEGAKVSARYGSTIEFPGYGTLSDRHTFLIDPEGIVQRYWLLVSPARHSQEVLGELVDIQTYEAAN